MFHVLMCPLTLSLLKTFKKIFGDFFGSIQKNSFSFSILFEMPIFVKVHLKQIQDRTFAPKSVLLLQQQQYFSLFYIIAQFNASLISTYSLDENKCLIRYFMSFP